MITDPPENEGWKLVSFAGDCTFSDESLDDGEELGDICSVCGLDYCDECECPGPTQADEFEYREFNGQLYARPLE